MAAVRVGTALGAATGAGMLAVRTVSSMIAERVEVRKEGMVIFLA